MCGPIAIMLPIDKNNPAKKIIVVPNKIVNIVV
jgi:hypothetical protein